MQTSIVNKSGTLLFFIFSFNIAFSQTPVIRTSPTNINRQPTSAVNSNIQSLDTIPTRKTLSPIKRINQPAPPATNLVITDISKGYLKNLSKLNFAEHQCDPDCHSSTCCKWVYTNSATKYISKKEPKNWKESLMWRNIPKGAAYGRYEISLYPFSKDNSAIINTGIIETKGIDSVFFKIDYKNADTMVTLKTIVRMGNRPVKMSNTDSVAIAPVNQRVKSIPAKTSLPVFESGDIIRTFYKDLYSDYERKYYIRIVALDDQKNEIANNSTEVVYNTHLAKEWKPAPPPGPTIYDDYTITSLKYVPVHFADVAFMDCAVVTGYNDGADNNSFINSFKAAYPVGTIICPQPPKDKAWYEKAFDGVTGFITKGIDGAANYYNSTKKYLKDKFKEINCNANGTITVINPTTKLQQVAGPDVCETLSGAAFDYGMAAVGLPPSLPNVDDFTKLAEGQIVDLACDKMEEETGFPIPDEAREKIRKGFHDNIVAQSNKGVVNAGFLNVKPDPRGQFQTAYLEIEVTRTSNKYTKKAIAGFSIFNVCEVPNTYCEHCTNETDENHNASFRLFEDAFTQVPFLPNVGDKVKLIVVLKPQESWIHNNKNTGKMKQIERAPPYNEWYTPVTPDYKGITYSSGCNLLLNSKGFIKFNLGLNNADGLNTIFYHK